MLDAILDALVPGGSMYDQWDDPSNRSPWADFWYTSLGTPELAGSPTSNSQFFVSACFAATRLLCGVGSTSNLNLMRRTDVAGKVRREVIYDDPRQSIINHRPNADQTAIAWKSQAIAWQVNWGTAFSEIQRSTLTGEVVALWPIHPRRMRPFRDTDSNLWWHVRLANGQESDLKDEEVLRIPYIVTEDSGITGLGVATQARKAIGLSITLERSETQASKSGVPRIVVESPKPMTDAARINFRREWKELYEQGGESVALLVEDAKAKPLSFSAVDQQHVQRREFLIEEIARWYDIPPVMLRRVIKEMAGNIEQQGIDFKTYSLRFLDLWRQELAHKLLTPEEIRDGYYWAFDFSDLLRGNHEAMSKWYHSMFTDGIYSANDILEKMNENPHEGGDTYYVQGAMRPIDEPYNANEPQNPKGDSKEGKADPTKMESPNTGIGKAMNLLLAGTLRRMAVKETNKIKAEASKPHTFLSSVDEFYAKHTVQLAEALEPLHQAEESLGEGTRTATMAAEWCAESKRQLLDVAGTAKVGELSDMVSAAIETWSTTRVDSVVWPNGL